jgi:hypothetical protein
MLYQNRILLTLLVFVSFAFAQIEIDTGQLSIKLATPGNVYIDSTFISNQSVENLTLKTGEYKVSVFSSKTKKWNERGYEKFIKILPDQNINLTIKNTNLYYINSIPFGSNIIQNNNILGKTPAYININHIDESQKIIIQKKGFYDKNIFVDRDQNDYYFKLKPESINNEIIIASPGLDNLQAAWYREGFIAVSLLSSWAAFYFKREADKYYNKYTHIGDVALMNKYYDKTKKFDTFSDISISVSIASLGTYMYFLIFE